MTNQYCRIGAVVALLFTLVALPARAAVGYPALVELFADWQRFARPTMIDGVPDYSAEAMAAKRRALPYWQERLASIDDSHWPVRQRVDRHLVRAEMNGFAFRLHSLQPWARDPAFYASVRTSQSDTPAEEGPTIAGAIRLWQYSLWPRTSNDTIDPLDDSAERKLTDALHAIPPLLQAARVNLAESNARDLWRAGVRVFEEQAVTLQMLAARAAGAGDELRASIEAATAASDSFAAWLAARADSKTGPSGIGQAAYDWHLQQVLLVPMDWAQERQLMQTELKRAHAALRLEEAGNRALPPLEPVAGEEPFQALQAASIDSYLAFLRDNRLMPVPAWYAPALQERTFSYSPPDRRHFFHQATHRDPRLLWTHFYHYWDLERLQREPHASPIRRQISRYNVWMSRSEGLATVMEEWMLHAGLYAGQPRSREIVWIMLAARAARGYASLMAHDNSFTMAEAGAYHVAWTPRGWMRSDLDLLGFEQHLYLRQPGYGTSYVTGARLLDDLLATRARQQGDDFRLYDFFESINSAGMIPVSLLYWELTGDDRLVPPGAPPPWADNGARDADQTGAAGRHKPAATEPAGVTLSTAAGSRPPTQREGSMRGTRIYSKSAIEEKARYARAAVVGDWVIVSGTMGQDPETGQLPANFEDQVRNSFAAIEAALAEAGASLDDVVRSGVFLVRREDTPALVALLAEKFADIRPANTTVVCDLPVPEALVEIEVMAYVAD